MIRANTFDDSVMMQLIGSPEIRLLSIYFAPSETTRLHPIDNHWATDWDVATIIRALTMHLVHSSKWHQVVVEV